MTKKNADSRNGTTFYKDAGFQSVLVHIPKETKAKMEAIAAKEEWSLVLTARRLLCWAVSQKPTREQLQSAWKEEK